jgi:hypothetical protein
MRTLSRMTLGLVLAVAAGCGGGGPPPAEPKAPLTDASGPQPADPNKDTPPAPPAELWVLDPDKHAVPDAAASGRLGGRPFAPQAEIQGDTLTFRALQDGRPDRELTLKLSAELAKKAEGLKLTVKPDQPAGPEVPEVMTHVPDRKDPGPFVSYPNGYGLTLELGKRAGGKLPGKVYLALPGDDRSYLAGAFSADWVRPLTDPPGPDDAPFIQGKVNLAGGAGDDVRVGYVGAPKEGTVVLDILQMPVGTPGVVGQSDHNKPRVTRLVAGDKDRPVRYEHTKLPPGRYLVFASLPNGPAAWTWVAVEPGAQLTADFTLDASKTGGLEVTLPAGTSGPVYLVPADDPAKPLPDLQVPTVAFSLGLTADPKDNKASFGKLGPGKYEVRAGELAAAVEIAAGKTEAVELMPKKK